MKQLFDPHVTVEEALKHNWAKDIPPEQTVEELLHHFGSRSDTLVEIVKALNKSWEDHYDAYMKQFR